MDGVAKRRHCHAKEGEGTEDRITHTHTRLVVVVVGFVENSRGDGDVIRPR